MEVETELHHVSPCQVSKFNYTRFQVILFGCFLISTTITTLCSTDSALSNIPGRIPTRSELAPQLYFRPFVLYHDPHKLAGTKREY